LAGARGVIDDLHSIDRQITLNGSVSSAEVVPNQFLNISCCLGWLFYFRETRNENNGDIIPVLSVIFYRRIFLIM
jgi:hypothetical protein